MDETVLKIAFAGLMHDIGKLAEGSLSVSDEFLNNNADLYQPFYQGNHTHRHAVYTAAFIDHIEKLLPIQFNKAEWGFGDTFINLAAGHHKPSTPLQWIIAIADRVSSGWDRANFDKEYNHAVAWSDYKKTRLLPIFEHLMEEDRIDPFTSNAYFYCYPLQEVSPKNIFPGLEEHVCPSDNKEATAEYKHLFDEFVFALERLLHKDENLPLWLEHFESLFMIFTSSIPAARAGHVIPDVSLYDHSKTTAAIAVALYLYHYAKDSMTIEEIKDYDQKKFLLIKGDFYGIQNFIFSDSGEVRKHRSKILRGRSFAVSLFSELAADMLCREIGLPSTSIVLNAAGNFTIIAPNTEEAKKVIDTVESRINNWLIGVSYGENSMGISFIEASAEDFVMGKFGELWDKLTLNMEKKKFQKIDLDCFGGAVAGYLDGFHNDLKPPLCPFCGKRASDPEAEGSKLVGKDESSCRICRDHIFLGTNLVKKNRVAVTTADAEIRGAENKLIEPVFGYYQVAFIEGELNELAKKGKLLKYWDISIHPDGMVSKDVTARFINGYVPVYGDEDQYDERILAGEKSDAKKLELIEQIKAGSPKTFEHIAAKALNPKNDKGGFCGIAALGVLKADVDNLGLLMTCGLKAERFTLSRLATLSRQLNWFFALYLPYILRTDARFKDIYTVFGGGDDLFLIGPWNRIVELAGFLHGKFAEYVCHNYHLHFSAGISLHKPHVPLDKLAELAEAALKQSKDQNKNRITLFSITVTWYEFFKLQEINKTLSNWNERKLINNAMIYRLNDFIDMSELEKQIVEEGDVRIEDMECLKWPALFSYTTERNIGKGIKEEEKRKGLKKEFAQSAGWLKEYGSKLRIALWDFIYNHR